MPKFVALTVPRSKSLTNLRVAIALAAGIGLVIGALFKFHQWKQNPQNASDTDLA